MKKLEAVQAFSINTPVRIVASGGMGADYYGLIALTGATTSKGGGLQTVIRVIDPNTNELVQKKWRTDFLEALEEGEELENLEKLKCAIAHSKSSVCSLESADSVSLVSEPQDFKTNSEPLNSLNAIPTASESCGDISPTLQFTMTSQTSAQSGTVLMSSALESPASHSVMLDCAEPVQMKEICFPNSSESFAAFDHDGQLWKMSGDCSQQNQGNSSQIFCGSFPANGTMSNGALSLAPKWEECISESGSSLLPTPKAQDGKHPGTQNCKQGQTLHLSAAVQKKWDSENLDDPMAAITGKPKLSANFVEAMMGFPPNWTVVEELAQTTLCDTLTLLNGCQKPQTLTISPTDGSDSKHLETQSFQIAARSLGGDSPTLSDLQIWHNQETEEVSQITEMSQPEIVEEARNTGFLEATPSHLSADEENELHRLELKIERSFYDAGVSLKQIRDNKLYRAKHKTFENYCKERFAFSRINAHYKIAAAEVVDNLLTSGEQILPTSEHQVRGLVNLEPEEQAQVWRRAVEVSDGIPTSKVVKSITEKLKLKPLVKPADFCSVGDVFYLERLEGGERKYNQCPCVVLQVDNFTLLVGTYDEALRVSTRNLRAMDDPSAASTIPHLLSRISSLQEVFRDEESAGMILSLLGKKPYLNAFEEGLLEWFEAFSQKQIA